MLQTLNLWNRVQVLTMALCYAQQKERSEALLKHTVHKGRIGVARNAEGLIEIGIGQETDPFNSLKATLTIDEAEEFLEDLWDELQMVDHEKRYGRNNSGNDIG